MKTLLLIDDDPLTHVLVQNAVGMEYDLVGCFSIREGLLLLSEREDWTAILLDRYLPDGDGLSVCTKLRCDPRFEATPILFLSGLTAESEKVAGLFAGADDYIVKPFGALELRARLQARLRKTGRKLAVGLLEIELDTYRVFNCQAGSRAEIELTRTEFKMLVTLAQNPDRVFTRETLLQKGWSEGTHVSDRVVDSHISHLRKKLQGTNVEIEALRGEGYRLSLKNATKRAAQAA